jgi:hypothetical protein
MGRCIGESTLRRRPDSVRAFSTGVLKFLDERASGDLRAGSVLSDEMHVLQFSYGSGVFGALYALCGGSLPGDPGARGVVSGGGSEVAGRV